MEYLDEKIPERKRKEGRKQKKKKEKKKKKKKKDSSLGGNPALSPEAKIRRTRGEEETLIAGEEEDWQRVSIAGSGNVSSGRRHTGFDDHGV